MTLEFNATLRDKGLGNDDKKKILLEVPVSELKGKVEELTSFANKTVTIQVVPQHYTYSIPFDKSTNAPTQEYVVNNDGTIDFVQKEQTQLEVDEQGNIDIENRPFEVTKEIVDEFIRAARSLEFPGAINPRDVLCRSEDGESFEEIASDYDMAELTLINELESAREYYAPYAAAWDKKRNEVIFQDKQAENADSESSESDSKEPEEETINQPEETQNVSEDEIEPGYEQSKDEDSEDDPYK
ncbi:hypothetical protein P7D52_07925 [Enterococcus dongliensis]|uniref:Uncharacterized protein n=1 Tax=Enterococcus dongliensis TaxID=2559925 RepID=A0AAW8TH94_9ENTE|nr:hypothetical protein [Enterococcus dongliensis]MDT2635492.1 hypothetical protein [Enterococcus dongliensis]MDT2637669.1 hypothetical protein [Enterococcus dongliensis]MDT2642712.1 hypothetical protein [Enterococcus dongliensis]